MLGSATKPMRQNLLIGLTGVAIGIAITVLTQPFVSQNLESPPPFSQIFAEGALIDNKVEAEVNGQKITEAELVGDAAFEFFEIKNREYDFKLKRLKRLLPEKFLKAEAKSAGLSVDNFINQRIIGSRAKPSNLDYMRYLRENNVPKEARTDSYKENIMALLEAKNREVLLNAYINKLALKNPVKVYFPRPRLYLEAQPEDRPHFGSSAAPVQLVIFSAFNCDYCLQASEIMSKIRRKFGNRVHAIFRHFPFDVFDSARMASEGSLCIADQGHDKFWSFYELVMAHPNQLSLKSLSQYAKSTGADVLAFETCYNSRKKMGPVYEDINYAKKVGVKFAPTLVVNGQLFTGNFTYEQIAKAIETELEIKR